MAAIPTRLPTPITVQDRMVANQMERSKRVRSGVNAQGRKNDDAFHEICLGAQITGSVSRWLDLSVEHPNFDLSMIPAGFN